MRYQPRADGFVVEAAQYRAEFQAGPEPAVHVWRHGQPMLSLPAVSALTAVEKGEVLTDVRLEAVRPEADAVSLTLTAGSDLWSRRTFHWAFHEDRVEHYHRAGGSCAPGRCYFFSSAAAQGDGLAVVKNVTSGAFVHAHKVFSPGANMADEYERVPAIPQSLGILPEAETPFAYGVPDRVAMIFAPPPLCLAFGRGEQWAGVGIGAAPGDYQFNSLEYSGVHHHGACFFVNYLGYRTVEEFTSPRAALHFGFTAHEVLGKYAAWTDAMGFSTRRVRDNPRWHRLPVFCGWGEQGRAAGRAGTASRDESTQANYERWLEELEQRGLPVGTVVIDDKWQAAYGTFDVDSGKWPDMAGFAARQHEAGRHVLLWIPTYHAEGLPEELLVYRDGKAVAGDVSNPSYEEFLRAKVRRLVRDIGIDGFKVDWVWGFARKPGVRTHAPLHGIEWLRRFQCILHDETHRWRPDAMIETHSANPLFRESSDVLRLNDLHPGARNIALAMAQRARLARIAGWDVIDCDASSDSLEEWWSYMQAQPEIGTPALYLVSGGGKTWPEVPRWMWPALAAIWRDYCGRV
jgi:hypothetical protein